MEVSECQGMGGLRMQMDDRMTGPRADQWVVCGGRKKDEAGLWPVGEASGGREGRVLRWVIFGGWRTSVLGVSGVGGDEMWIEMMIS